VQSASPEEFDGKLYSLGMTLGYNRECGGENGVNNAVLLCASAPAGSPCSGDSGSALTLPGSPPTLVGVMNAGAVIAGRGCTPGARNSFADVAAPEIQDFIDGSETPPQAPRGGGARCAASALEVGGSMSCEAGAWSNSPTFTYVFVCGETGRVLQSGSSSEYRFTTADAGHTVYLRLLAANPGGRGVDQTTATSAVAPGATVDSKPSRHVALVGERVRFKGHASLPLTIECSGPSRCEGKLELAWTGPATRRGKRVTGPRKIVIGQAGFGLAANREKTFKLKMNSVGRELLAHHGRLEAELTIVEFQSSKRVAHSRLVLILREN
jgi:hypothetical protein